jgi:hypothetical protein
MAVTITELLGTDSISGSRLKLNANFLLLENAYNDLEDSFNINVLTGSLDVSNATSGQIKAKGILANSMVMPSSGSPTIEIYGTGASAGFGVFSSTVSSATGIFSNTVQTNQLSTTGESQFGATATFSSTVNNLGSFVNGPSGSYSESNRLSTVGSGTPFPTVPGAGVTGTFSEPYTPTLTEKVVYINSEWNSALPADSIAPDGFFFLASTGSGAADSIIPAGFTVTFIDASTIAGKIPTGVTGPGGSEYYTGFSTGDGQYTDPEIVTPGSPYQSSFTVMWEPRVGQSSLTQKGSWVVISSTGNFTF